MLLAKEYKILTKTNAPTSINYEDLINIGLPTSSIEVLGSLFNTDKKGVARVLNITVRRLDQMKAKGIKEAKLNKGASERALQVTRLFQEVVDYFGDKDGAQAWFNSPNPTLDNKTPLQACSTFTGMGLVRDALLKLKYGMTA